jgi:nicotinamide riboside kinase
MVHASSNARGPKNIYIIGSQSSGKTTLISALTTYFANKSDLTWRGLAIQKHQILKEVARQVLQDHESTGQDISESETRALELQTFILEA